MTGTRDLHLEALAAHHLDQDRQLQLAPPMTCTCSGDSVSSIRSDTLPSSSFSRRSRTASCAATAAAPGLAAEGHPAPGGPVRDPPAPPRRRPRGPRQRARLPLRAARLSPWSSPPSWASVAVPARRVMNSRHPGATARPHGRGAGGALVVAPATGRRGRPPRADGPRGRADSVGRRGARITDGWAAAAPFQAVGDPRLRPATQPLGLPGAPKQG